MAANAFGSSVATLPLYFASNALARSISRARVCSILESSGDEKRSLRFQRTVSAPVDLVAWDINLRISAQPARAPVQGLASVRHTRLHSLPPSLHPTVPTASLAHIREAFRVGLDGGSAAAAGR